MTNIQYAEIPILYGPDGNIGRIWVHEPTLGPEGAIATLVLRDRSEASAGYKEVDAYLDRAMTRRVIETLTELLEANPEPAREPQAGDTLPATECEKLPEGSRVLCLTNGLHYVVSGGKLHLSVNADGSLGVKMLAQHGGDCKITRIGPKPEPRVGDVIDWAMARTLPEFSKLADRREGADTFFIVREGEVWTQDAWVIQSRSWYATEGQFKITRIGAKPIEELVVGNVVTHETAGQLAEGTLLRSYSRPDYKYEVHDGTVFALSNGELSHVCAAQSTIGRAGFTIDRIGPAPIVAPECDFVVDMDGDRWELDSEGRWHCRDQGLSPRGFDELVRLYGPVTPVVTRELEKVSA